MELLTDKEMALLFNVKESTIRSWKFRNQIPEEVMFKLPGTNRGTTRYIKDKVYEWINGNLAEG